GTSGGGGLGGGGFGTTGGGTNTAGTTDGQGNFIGGNQSQNFIGGGRQANGQQGTNRQFQAFQNNQNTSSQGTQSTGTPRQIRTALRVNIPAVRLSNGQTASFSAPANAATLERFVARRPEFSSLAVSLAADGTAVITGVAGSEEDRRLAGNLLRLQPGVKRVDNQVTLQ
ncbi:MAG: BON domain-containing protein, partial [Planctomycetaceae bacterium]